MSKITKYRCDFCCREVEDPYLEAGWVHISGAITRAWGIRKNGGDAQNDYLKDVEFCNIGCLVSALDGVRRNARGPKPVDAPRAEADPFKPEKKPWEDPLPPDDDECSLRQGPGHDD